MSVNLTYEDFKFLGALDGIIFPEDEHIYFDLNMGKIKRTDAVESRVYYKNGKLCSLMFVCEKFIERKERWFFGLYKNKQCWCAVYKFIPITITPLELFGKNIEEFANSIMPKCSCKNHAKKN